MFRLLSRLLALFFLAFAVMYIVIDAARTIAGTGFIFTALKETLLQLMPEHTLQFTQWAQMAFPAFVNDMLLATAFKSPTFVVAAVFALVFYALSRKTRRSIGRFSLD